ncbi:PPTC7 [Bugula neritina]|uniref:Protein phosphatase n=1 Tax=Bugula neritina TaxID=10212 RepID=A0A7J7KI60_BUGNE|nr:PPTC7 [Bugula neritina]
MSLCARLVERGKFSPACPDELLENSYEEALLLKNEAMGSTTACIISLDTEASKLYTANLGDSGYMVVRNGRILARSQEQQHYFNSPFQLTLVPPAYRGRVLSDRYITHFGRGDNLV